MASLAAIGRLSGRLASRKLAHDAVSRGFRTSASALAAQNFTMPALSPTMTEGNIATWRVKEGEKFSAGDVLLEIETDKATMDVEAQEEGVLMKIFKGDGAKSIPVGTRIAVVAEEGDDVASLEIPADESESSSKKDAAPSESESSSPPPPATEPAAENKPESSKKQHHTSPKRTFPHFPSVAQLVKEKGLDKSAVASITPTGPQGRLLKGDVLAYLGAIGRGTPAAISERFEKLSHLDLSDIKVAAPKPKAEEAPAAKKEGNAAAAAPQPPKAARVAVTVSLAPAIELQKKLSKKLGVALPLPNFIVRASDLANEDLPAVPREPTADELFDQIVGFGSSSGPRLSQGQYVPQVTPIGATPVATRLAPVEDDLIDFLSGAAPARAPTPAAPVASINSEICTLSLTVPPVEQYRAAVFLDRVKVVLENQPGRLVV